MVFGGADVAGWMVAPHESAVLAETQLVDAECTPRRFSVGYAYGCAAITLSIQLR